MPSTSIQSRINVFEALAGAPTPSPTTSFPSSKSRLYGPADLLETPISPTANTFQPILPLAANVSSGRSRSPSPTRLGRKTSLIDLKDWVVEDGPFGTPSSIRQTHDSGEGAWKSTLDSKKLLPPRKRTPGNSVPNSTMPPLINLDSPPKQRPLLPPRKPSHTSAEDGRALRALSASSDPIAVLCPPGHSGSLTIEHTYPPVAHQFGTGRVCHVPASSISSFHSVSLSSDGSNLEVPSLAKPSPSVDDNISLADMDSASTAESFEDVSASSAISPSTAVPFDWEAAVGKLKFAPKPNSPRSPSGIVAQAAPLLPPRPLARSSSMASTTTAVTRRVPPPPPPLTYQPRSSPSRTSVSSPSASPSDRSSTHSTATTTSRTSISTHGSALNLKTSSLHRPPPAPPSARVRYEALFASAVLGQLQAERQRQHRAPPSLPAPQARKVRQAAGWRGLSLDLTPRPDTVFPAGSMEQEPVGDGDESDKMMDAREKLNGCTVKFIWKASRLDRRKLRNIWNECDPEQTGYLDRGAFVRGMWRIDEELRRAQLAHRTSALTAASSQRIPHRPLPRNDNTPRPLP